jgi:hypothetical protein
MDWTDFDADNQATIMVSLVSRHGRSTPLAACRTEVYSMIANDDFACANVHRALDRVQSALFRS